jgi:UDP-N-acetylglucosamine--N-acetylmuramyl-(pentapeptide) pyrophosphoryl-undecaprenol N-acetylglucosamine transferase
MSLPVAPSPFIAIACGGTGGHLFPGLAVADQLKRRGCAVGVLISPKDVDQQAVKSAQGVEVFTLPAVALQNGNYLSFARSFWQSWRAAKKIFQSRPPQAVLAMGGFTSAPPVLAGNAFGAKTFLHESNTIPGRANRLLARFVDEAFVGFSEAGSRLKARKVTTTGTPVRPQFSAGHNLVVPDSAGAKSAQCRIALGLDPNRPVVLVMGGSQGARALNEMILAALPLLAGKNWQWLHLTGANDFEKVQAACAARGIKAVVKPFLAEMDLALGAATASVSRSGASSLAEIAAMQLPSLLVPYPAAADNHQFVNASAFEKSGAAKLLEQKSSTPEKVAAILTGLVGDESARVQMQSALARWHTSGAAGRIAGIILDAIAQPAALAQPKAKQCGCGHAHGPAKHAH